MKKIARKKAIVFLCSGMLLMAITQIISHYIIVSDVAKGLFTGIGIGLLLTALLFGNFKLIHSK